MERLIELAHLGLDLGQGRRLRTLRLLGALLGTALIAAASTLVSSVWTQIVAEITVFGLAIVVIRLFPRGLTGARR